MSENETVQEMEILRHMLGVGSHIPKRFWGSRNYFNADEGHADMPILRRLEAKGLITAGRVGYWHATQAGCAAIAVKVKS
jgi:hypothetical protein